MEYFLVKHTELLRRYMSHSIFWGKETFIKNRKYSFYAFHFSQYYAPVFLTLEVDDSWNFSWNSK